MKRLIFPALFGLALAGCSSSQNETSTTAPTQNIAIATEAPSTALPPIPTTEPNLAPAAAVATATQRPSQCAMLSTKAS